MKDQLDKVLEFHKSFNIQQSNRDPQTGDFYEMRHKLMEEENDEYLHAAANKDMVGVADALGDKLYILCGTILMHGMQDIIQEVFDEIHDSNMTKLGEDGQPIYNEYGKVLKGPNYRAPNLKQFLKDNDNTFNQSDKGGYQV